ncbi:MFS general substrate transporter [Parathielavia appendiculata]|uniref:MFS general substrate transporter n=1 Tax=Parathielavia appendiculata TaxID=2587402 RepID=A0AAN6TPJ2_9PEZI|nr:MFS general substrate transporter [Parathielavia appendiculata]
MAKLKSETLDSMSISQQTDTPKQDLLAASAQNGRDDIPSFTVAAGQELTPLSREYLGRETLELAKLTPIFGWRLWVTIACLCAGLFLSSLETTIIATALVSISSSLGGYDKSNWVATSYLITYTGFLIIFARISDMFGRKGTLCGSIIIFTAFSLACGLAQTMTQLIIFRAFQGIGGAGVYSLAMGVMAEITPLRYLGISSGLMGAIFALSSLLGPILGGVITSHTTWRWIFYLNVPLGVSILALVLWIFPVNSGVLSRKRQAVSYIDYPGMVLSLAGSVMLTFGLEEGGLAYSWNSPPVVVAFVVAGVAFVAFGVWEWYISEKRNSNRKLKTLPLFPVHLATRRVSGFALLTALIAGFPFMMTIIFLPQRFQLQNGLSPIDAGIRMLALLILSATGAGLGGIIATRRNISWYILAGSLALQLVGLGLMSTLPTAAGEVRAAQYGYQVVLGLGFGLTLSSLAIVLRMEVDAADSGVAFSAITQVRVLGGLIGIAVGQAVLTRRLLADLGAVLPPEKIAALLRSTTAIADFTPEEAADTAQVYGEAFNLQNRVMLGFGAAGLLACLGAWKRHPVEFADLEEKRRRAAGGETAADQTNRAHDGGVVGGRSSSD